MKIRNIKILPWLAACGIFTMISLGACSTGTDPGDVNTERGDIVEEGSMVEKDDDPMSEHRDTTDMESHYDHADHEKHGDNKAGAVHDGTGKKGGVERDNVDN